MISIRPSAILPLALALSSSLALAAPTATDDSSTQIAAEVITAHGVGVFGPPKLPADFTHLAYVNPDAPKGGEISEWAPGGFDSYNPFTIKGRAAALSTIMLESLMAGTADEAGAAYCLLCDTIEYPESRDWVIFHLRPEARFSDGTPVTADDVLFSFEQLRDKGLSSFRAIIAQQVTSAEVLDPARVRFTFTPDYPRRDVIQSVGSLPIFSRKDFEENQRDLGASSNKPFVGSGPYMFASADISRRVVWKRNPDWWGADLPINRGRNNFDRIRIEYFGDYDSAFEAFKAGEYSFRNEASSIIWATRYDFPAMKAGWIQRETLANGNVASGQAWAINLRRPDFQDVRVREAIGLLFNFQWANESLFYGLYSRVTSFWDNSDLAASGKPGPAELEILTPLAADLPDGILTDEAVMPAVSGARQMDRPSMRKASELLNEAGWVVGDDGMRRKDGRALKISILNDSQTFDRVLNPYVANLRAVGIDAQQTRVDDAQYTVQQRNHDFDMITAQLGQDLIPGAGLQQYFSSHSTDDVFNAMGLANPAIDKLISLVEAATSEDEMTVRVHALDRALRALRFWVPQWYKADHTVAYWDMYGHPETLPPYTLGELDFWWFDADKAAKLKQAGAIR